MSWFKVDDTSAFNAKVMAAGNEAWGAFCRLGAWCAQQLSDGAFSRAIAVTIAPMRVWEKLAAVGLVDRLENGEMQMHDYLQRNPSKAQVLAEREAAKLRMQRVRSPYVRPNNDRTNGSSDGEVPAGLGWESGSDPEVTESKVVPVAPRVPVGDPDVEAIAGKIREHDVFRSLDARRIAMAAAHRLQGGGNQKRSWVLTAIDECAEKSDGLGLSAEALQAKLVGFMKAAKVPRKDVAARAHEVEQREEAWEREKHAAIAPSEVLKRIEGFGKIGAGGR